MAKFVIIKPGVVGGAPIDWDKCIICREDTLEKLQCPADSKRKDNFAGYASFADILPAFSDANLLPHGFDMQCLDDGEGVLPTLISRRAKWHKTCRLFYYQTQLDRAVSKRKHDAASASDVDCLPTDDNCIKRTMYRRSVSTDGRKSSLVYKESVCFLCDDRECDDALHAVSTLGLDNKVRDCAHVLGDAALLAKLSDSDLVAQEAKYHTRCLLDLYGRREKHVRQMQHSESEESMSESESFHGIVFAQLVSYIEEMRSDNSVAPIFKLCDLAKMYSDRLSQLTTDNMVLKRVHSTRLKERLQEHFPKMRAQVEGRDVLLVFESDIGPALVKACQHDSDQDAMCLSRAAQIVRRYMFDVTKPFSGTFSDSCQQSSVPPKLLALVAMILEGPNITAQTQHQNIPAALSISQLLIYNCVQHNRNAESASGHIRRSTAQETPLPLYISLMLHATTRKRSLVDRLFHLGLCVSYDRILELTADLANGVCERYTATDIVCPPKLHNCVFTVAAVDNIDHNMSSTTASSSFHGTSISLMQQPDQTLGGTQSISMSKSASKSKRVRQLPSSYTDVPPVRLKTEQPEITLNEGPLKGAGIIVASELNREYIWLDTVRQFVDQGDIVPIADVQWLSWSAYHAKKCTNSDITLSNISLFPIFPDSSNSVAMIKHSMDVIQNAINFLNPGQVPTITFDQPLYAIAKTIQWNWPDTYGEDKFVIVMGGLHIEMAALKALGALLKDSGWVEAVSSAGIATSGTAEALLSASHVRRCRHIHEVTVCAIHMLQYRAYDLYCSSLDDETSPLSFTAWCEQQTKHPQFAYWSIVKELQLIVMTFIRALRTSNFTLYVDSLTKLVPYFFALDRTHYARWLSVHIRDMASLATSCPSTFAEFMAGKFTVKKTGHPFSAMAIDQAHEQTNASVKGDGGAIGLTDDEHALRRWMIAGPEVARLIQEFETKVETDDNPLHHEQRVSVQETFKREVSALLTTISEMGNPFIEDGDELTVLHSRFVITGSSTSDIAAIKSVGQAQYDEFVQQRLTERSVSLYAPLKRNKLSPFIAQRPSCASKSKQLLRTTKSDCDLFSRLYIGCQTRNGNLDTFFSHENQPYPPSISEFGALRFGVKADLLPCLEKLVIQTDAKFANVVDTLAFAPQTPIFDMMALDGAVVVQMLKPGKAKTFTDYATDVFEPYITSQIAKLRRLDIVWDSYIGNSLKSAARTKRGTGARVRVGPNVPIPHKWLEFLRVNDNKSELFQFLSEHSVRISIPETKCIVATLGQDVLSSQITDFNMLAPCTHEEADTRLLLHAFDAANAGYKKVVIRSVDTDVLVLAVSVWHQFQCDELWLAFGSGKHFRYLPVHEIANSLGPQKSRALLAFHALTGCDTTSSFHGKGKKSAWETWSNFPAASDAFLTLVDRPVSLTDETFSVLERFFILLYDRTSHHICIDSARQFMFTKKGMEITKIPPTKDALQQHVKRATYQSGHIWSQALVAAPVLPDPSDWGWSSDKDGWNPIWMTIPDADKCCLELLCCGCKTGCITRRCKCERANLKCTALCGCDGECVRD